MKKKYLVIRRDNIGDLVCTTPLINLIAQTYPSAQLDVLVNSYNAAVVRHHPHIHQVYAYTKAKHREAHSAWWSIYWQRCQQLLQLRRERYDAVFFCQRTDPARVRWLAKWLAAKKIIYFADTAHESATETALALSAYRDQHEAKVIASMISALGIKVTEIPSCQVYPCPQAQQHAQAILAQQPWHRPERLTLAIHISARKPSQRWPVQKFVALIQTLAQQDKYQFVLFWSPGSENNASHPGDDEKAQDIIRQVKHLPVLPYPTHQLEELIAGLSICDQMICSDGGAMHIGAGLGKLIVCLFGGSNLVLWHPWGVPYQLLQLPSRQVRDLSVEEVVRAVNRLQMRCWEHSLNCVNFQNT